MCVRYVGVDRKAERAAIRKARQGGDGGSGNAENEVIVNAETEGSGNAEELFPGRVGRIIRLRESGLYATDAMYGILPPWAGGKGWGNKRLYNVRSETMAWKAPFAEAFKSRRCIILLETVYERMETSWLKVSPADGEPFKIAGLWAPEDHLSKGLDTYALVTTEPAAVIRPLHDRMPVMLNDEGMEIWLDPNAKPDMLMALTPPCPDE